MDRVDSLERRTAWLIALGAPPLRGLAVPRGLGLEPLTRDDFREALRALLPPPFREPDPNRPRDLPLGNFAILDFQGRVEQHVQDRVEVCNGMVLNWLQGHGLLGEEWVHYALIPIIMWDFQRGWDRGPSRGGKSTLDIYKDWSQDWLLMLRRLQQMSETDLWDTVDFREACHLMLAAWETIGEPLLPGCTAMEMPRLGPS